MVVAPCEEAGRLCHLGLSWNCRRPKSLWEVQGLGESVEFAPQCLFTPLGRWLTVMEASDAGKGEGKGSMEMAQGKKGNNMKALGAH